MNLIIELMRGKTFGCKKPTVGCSTTNINKYQRLDRFSMSLTISCRIQCLNTSDVFTSTSFQLYLQQMGVSLHKQTYQ